MDAEVVEKEQTALERAGWTAEVAELVGAGGPIAGPWQFMELACVFVAVRDHIREIEERHDAEIKAAFAAHRKLTGALKDELRELNAADELLKDRLAAYLQTWVLEARTASRSIVERDAALPEIEGFGWQRRVRAVVVNPQMLVRAVGRGKVPLEAVTVNTKWLNEQANALRTAMSVPGVRVEEYITPVVQRPAKG